MEDEIQITVVKIGENAYGLDTDEIRRNPVISAERLLEDVGKNYQKKEDNDKHTMIGEADTDGKQTGKMQ